MKESMPLLSMLVALEIVAGQVLYQSEDKLLAVPILLVMIPVINGVGGNLGSILGARLSSGLHVGSVELKFKAPELRKNILTTVLLGIVSYTSITIFILVVAPLLGISMETNGVNILLKAGLVMMGTGLLLIAIVIGISVFVARFSFENGFDPDNMVIPVVTTLSDLLGIVCLMIMIGAVGI